MIINYLGHSCFKFESKDTGAILIADPYDEELGLRVPKMQADIVTSSHSHKDHSNISAVKGINGEPFIINTPGEYEIKNIFIYGIPSFHDNSGGSERGANIIYLFEIDGINIAHLGDLGHILNNEHLEKIEGVDILLIPVGGKHSIDYKTANEVISQIEPRIVIPMHYKTEKIKLDIDPLDKFFKEMGISEPKIVDKLKITEKDLPQGTTEIIVMST